MRDNLPTRIDSIDELRVFTRVVEAGSLSSAARTLGLSTNLVSRRIASLEERVGATLLARTTRRMSLTDEGRRFHARCIAVLEAIEDAESELGRGEGAASGRVRVVVPTVMTRADLVMRLGRLMEANPGLEVQLLVRDGAVDLVGEGIDVAIRVGEVNATGLVARMLSRATPTLAVSSSYARRRGVPAKPGDLANHPCLRFLGDARQTHWTLLDSAGRAQIVPIGAGLECDDSRALMDGVRAGLGVGFLPRAEVASGDLVRVLPRHHLPGFPVRLVSHPGRTRLARVAKVVEVLEAVWNELV